MDTTILDERCFACGRPIHGGPRRADTRDDQIVYVGSDCLRKIEAAGERGYKPPGIGPRLYPIREDTMPPAKRRPAAKPRRKQRGTAYLVSAAKVVARREAVGAARGRALTQEEAATLAGLHRPNYARMEQGDTNPTVDVAVRVARALGCLVEDLIVTVE